MSSISTMLHFWYTEKDLKLLIWEVDNDIKSHAFWLTPRTLLT